MGLGPPFGRPPSPKRAEYSRRAQRLHLYREKIQGVSDRSHARAAARGSKWKPERVDSFVEGAGIRGIALTPGGSASGFAAFSPGRKGWGGEAHQGDGGLGQDHRNRPRHHELGGRGDGGRPAGRHHERGGRPHDALGGRLHGRRRAAGRRRGQAPGGHQPAAHDLLDQALHGPAPSRRCPRRSGWSPTRSSRARTAWPPSTSTASTFTPARDLGDDPPEAEEGRGGLPRPGRDRRGDHGARLLQRRAAPGHQGRRARSPGST